MDHTKRKLQSDSLPPNGHCPHEYSETLAATAALSMPLPKRRKSGSDCCCSFDKTDVISDINDSSPTPGINEDVKSVVVVDSIAFNPASKMATGQWRVAKSPIALDNPTLTEDDDNDADEEPGKVGLSLDNLPKLDNDDDSDVNLVMDLLMRKVCLNA